MPFSLENKGVQMIETVLVVILFIIGIYFGSFFTLATYRLPKKENITHKHSYCPNCNHKLGILDLIPVFSYVFLKGKCRYCKNKIGIRYFLYEILTGIVFVLFGISLKISLYPLDIEKITYLGIGILYLSSLFIIVGINKEKNTIQKSVIYYGVFVSIIYIIYSCTLTSKNVYKYAIYLCFIISLMILDTVHFKRNLKNNETIQLINLILYMMIITGEKIILLTVVFTILIMGIENIIKYFKYRKSSKAITNKEKKAIPLYICISNIILVIGMNFIQNYMIIK